MAQTPNPKSQEQLVGEMLGDWLSRTGINDTNPGSLTTQLFEVFALIAARTSGDAFQILRDLSVDRASGEPLKRIATDEGLREIPARVSTGAVTVTDTSFVKISTKIYTAENAPNIGSTEIFVSDASLFPNTGSIYIGRGSPNIEGPIAYTAKTPIGGHWSLTLATGTTKFHNINETVVLAQGGARTIPTGIVVRAPSSGASADINFVVSQAAVILDGETSISNVQVSAQEVGVIGNVPIGAIKEFASSPFAGATVTNPLPFKTGRDVESDEQLRIRIKRARLSRGLGTALAVKSSVIGAAPSDENAVVVSSEIITSANETTLYIDDNTGYEQKTEGVGIEYLTDSALGGETNFQLETGGRQTSVAKAFILSNLTAPFDVRGTDKLAISVGGITTEHTFQDSDFASPGGATAYELVASINANSDLNFEAATSEGGTKVVLQGKENSNEQIQTQDVTIGRNVADLIELPSNEVQTLRLFKNRKPLSKDGNTATIKTERQANWSNTIASGDTLIVSVDDTASITYTILNSDFVEEGSHPTVASTNSLESWVNVLNKKITGATASIVGEQIFLTSNLGASNRAKMVIDPSSTLVSKNMFSTASGLISVGKNSDFVFSRNTAQIKLKDPLTYGDELAAGSRETEARVSSARILGGILTLIDDAYLWFLIDDLDAQIVNTGVSAATLFEVSKPAANIVRYESAIPTAFSSVEVGDYVIVWSEELSAGNRLEGRVNAVTANTLDIKVTSTEYTAAVAESGILFEEGFVVLRTTKVPQKFKIVAGTKTMGEIADELNTQTDIAKFVTVDDEILVLNTNTKTTDGAVMVVTFDSPAKSLGFVAGTLDTSSDSMVAFYESGLREGSMPAFIHSSFSSGESAVPPDSYLTSVDSVFDPSSVSLDPNYLLGFLQPYGSILDALSPSEKAVLKDYLANTLTLAEDYAVKRLRVDDRYYFANPLDFGHEDSMVVVLDGNISDNTFNIPFYRTATTNTSLAVNPNTFNAYDTDGGPTTPFTDFFGSDFAFDDFKVLMKAKRVIDHSANEDAILWRSARWGRSGEQINIAYIYPTAANSPIQHTTQVGEDIKINIVLKSDAPVATTIDGTTEWDVTITPNTPVAGVDQVTYTYTGTGTAPGLGGLAGGEYVTIQSGSELDSANTGTYRVSDEVGFTPTANSFTIVRANGEAVTESDKATLVASVFNFYLPENTTAEEIVDYVATSTLTNIVTAELVDDSGITGAGVIDRSTFEFSDFTIESIYLLDGINWLSTSNISGSPQFTFKRALSYASDTGYAFNNAEELRIVPTTLEQSVRFANILAVTGYTTLGGIQLSSRGSRMELSTNVLGGEGSVQIIGGTANSVFSPVIANSVVINNQYTLSSFNRASLNGFHSDQWVKLVSGFKQAKETSFRDTASISVDADFGTVGESRVRMFGKTLTDRHFGKPRNHVRVNGRTFKVEKQGDFVCISWDGTGTQPFFSQSLNLNTTSGGTLNIEKVTGTSEANVYILSGPVNFTELSIGDDLAIDDMLNAENNGTFLVTGVSDDGKTVRVLNANAVNEFSFATFTITDNADIASDEFVVDGNILVAGVDFVVGATAADSAINLASAISALPGVTATATGPAVEVVATSANANIAIAYNNIAGVAGATVSGAFLVGRPYLVTSFVCNSSVTEGDNAIISSPFNVLNQGKFRVVRRYENSIYIENENAVEELVSIPSNLIDLEEDGTTSFDVENTDNKLTLRWDGTGTEPDLSVARPGDELTLGTDFDPDNQGTFTVLRSEAKLQQITRAKLIAGSLITSGDYWEINAAGDVTEYYVWYDVDGGGGDPMIVGKTGIPVVINSVDTAIQVANATSAAIDAEVDFEAFEEDQFVTITTVGFDETTASTEGNMDASFDIETLQSGQRTFLQALNPAVVAESGIVITDVLELNRPQMIFYDYEATVKGDSLNISNNFIGEDNQSAWLVEEVLDENTIIVIGTMESTEVTSLAGFEETVFVEEDVAYVGYKKINFVVTDPSTSQRGLVLFDTKYQANKINDTGNTLMSTQNKFDFNMTITKGLDSYRYHTGLIGEANRIVYGDPRDSITYQGVAAAGAEIFIREPLFRRVRVAIDVRIDTGIPFVQITEQIRTNITALIDGNPIGQSIAISDIVETVNIIPGVRAVAISSPLYNSSNDTIRIAPSEKSRIIDPSTDVLVRQIGS